jgi:anti-sigma B factor antagonist
MVGLGNGALDPGERPRLVVERLDTDADTMQFKIAGQLDVSTEATLREVLDDAVASEPDTIVLEASGLDFMDSSGLAVLLVAARQVDRLELRDPTAIVRRVIAVAGLAETLRMTPDE